MKSSFFKANGYKCIQLSLSSEGQYSPKDSEWNYSDIPHLNYIHTKVEGIAVYAGRTHISNIFLQKIGPFKIPASVNISHLRPEVHEYCMIILNIAIFVTTTHGKSGGNSVTTTNYKFMYKGALGYLIGLLARMATKRNYRTLMSEDMPMRLQRGKLRQRGITFELDKQDLIGFKDTLDINKNHVNAQNDSSMNQLFEYIITTESGEAEDRLHLLNFTWENGSLNIFTSICPHEGADLLEISTRCSDRTKLHCPWHGKKIYPTATISLISAKSTIVSVYNKLFTIQTTPKKGTGLNKVILSISTKDP